MTTPQRAALAAAALAVSLSACTTHPHAAADNTPAAAHAPAAATAGTAALALQHFPVRALAPKTGYVRTQKFGPAWSDHTTAPGAGDHCNTRDQVLRRDLSDVRFKGASTCIVASGTLVDPYTGQTIHFTRGRQTSSAVQIDHIVALRDSWQTGAASLTQSQREALANDPIELVAASGAANEAKGDADASAWLPPSTAYQCAYVARQIAVKARYGLWVTPAEKAAMTKVLATCPGQPLPTESSPDVAYK